MKILELVDLAVVPNRTKRQQITVALLAEYYETYLNPHYYNFELSNGVTIQLDFHKEKFCHLIGIGQIADKHFPPNDPKLFMHKGKGGFKRAKNGSIKLSYLRKLHQYEYLKQEKKFLFFHFLHIMMESGNLKVANYSVIANSKITCDFMFHDTYDNALLHLGIENNPDTGMFYPKTFFPMYLTDPNFDKYIDPKNVIDIIEVTKTPRT